MNAFVIIAVVLLGAMLAMSAHAALPENAGTQQRGDYVVLLHGLGRTSLSMKRLEIYLRANGYRVINLGYPSRRFTIEQIAENYLAPELEKKITDRNCKIHFVTHSLGGIMVRQYLANHYLENLGRVVMIGPPNHGSAIIDRLRSNLLSREFLGLAGRELGTTTNDLPAKLGPVHFDCGVIAGDCTLNPILSAMLTGPNDGKVTVESTKVSGMSDFLLLHYSHTWLTWRERTLRETRRFLELGNFSCAGKS